jgi:hypothetical protein
MENIRTTSSQRRLIVVIVITWSLDCRKLAENF